MERATLDRPLGNIVKLDWEKTLYILIIILALATRLWGLGDHVQSHDESIHTKYSWNLYMGHGFQHNPLMHGPFLFHITALTYFLIGDNDFSARLPVALIGVAIVAFPYLLRRWLGRAGALLASFFLLTSPSIAYYSRYIRHDIPVILWSLVVVLAVFCYLWKGHRRWLYLMAAGVSLMFATKEVAFIYNAIFGLFLIGLFVTQAMEREWPNEKLKPWFAITLVIMAVGLFVLGLGLLLRPEDQVVPAWWAVSAGLVGGLALVAVVVLLLVGHLQRDEWRFPLYAIALIATVVVLGILFRIGIPALLSNLSRTQPAVQGYAPPERAHLLLTLLPFVSGVLAGLGWLAVTAFRNYRTFNLIVILGTLCLPFLSPFLIQWADVDPIAYSGPTIYYSAAILIEVLALSAAIGLMWDLQRHARGNGMYTWLVAAAIHYAIFLVLFTSVFTNGQGIATGLVGSLGYWLVQQDVERGSQPQYYYVIMVSLYEYLPLLLTLATLIYLSIRRMLSHLRPEIGRPSDSPALKERFVPFVLWWIALSWVGYAVAGEKMPWLTVHLALPMILLSGWLVGRLVEGIDWRAVLQRRAWLLALAAPPFIIASVTLVHSVLSGPFQGQELAQLYITGQFMGALVGVLALGMGSGYLVWHSGWRIAARALLLLALLVPVLLTIRTAWRFCYVNYDYPTEFLVYAHSAPGIKEVMEQIEELSRRVAGGSNLIKVAYGSDASTQFYWQLRNYPNAVFYGDSPSREQMDAPVIIAGRDQWDAVIPYVGKDYLVNTYTFMWWPMEDYRNLTWQRIKEAITNPQKRAALWDIWYNRDYRRYDESTGKTHTLDKWPLRSDLRLYIRRDVAAQMWNLSTTSPVAEEGIGLTDPYAAGWQELTARLVFGSPGSAPGQLQSPRGIKIGPDGFVYVADAGNHRIQKFTADGQFVAAWGRHSVDTGRVQGFNDPWDAAVAPDGTIYVADTWNHRIQKLDAEGNPITAWGMFGEYTVAGEDGQGAFYGPRGIAIGPDGLIYVADTGNKRIQVFDPDGEYVSQWGGGGVLEGYLDEPVGIAIGPGDNDEVYVADTWNQRVQVFSSAGVFLRQWPVAGWDSGLAEEKPYLALDAQGYVYVTDPGYYRVLVFNSLGDYVMSFGQYGSDDSSFGLPMGIAVGADGSIYVTDAHGGRVMVFPPLDVEP